MEVDQVLDLEVVEAVEDGFLGTIVGLIPHHPMQKILRTVVPMVGGGLVSGQVLLSVDWQLNTGTIGDRMSQGYIGINGTKFLCTIKDQVCSGVGGQRDLMIMTRGKDQVWGK